MNFRDVGQALKELTSQESIIPQGKLFRGGEIGNCSWEQMGSPKTIINFRGSSDNVNSVPPHVKLIHLPLRSVTNCYINSNETIVWAKKVI